MFCPECGTELRENAAFCPECGSKVSAAEPTANGAESISEETVESSGVVKEGQGVLKDEVRYAPHLKEPITDIPESKPTGSELGDELTKFANIYEVSVENYMSLLDIQRAKGGLGRAGYQWYYDHANDPVIEASRQINAEIANTEQLLKKTRAQIAQNEQARLRAAQVRDNEKSRNQKSADKTAKWSGRKGGCLLVVLGFIGLGGLGLLGEGVQSGYPGPLIAGILTLAVCVALLVWYNKKSKSRVQNAQQSADALSRTADARFDQTMQELAQKDADLSAQCSQIEDRISELTPIAGEIRHQANERAQFLYSVEMLEIDELLKRVASAAISQTNTLREMGSIPDEEEWFESRHLAKIVTSGRADTLKEALQLLDTANYRDADLNVKGQMLEAQNMTNDILAVGFTEMIENQQKTIATIRSGFDDVITTMEIHHAQDVALQLKQISQNAQMLDQLAVGNDIAKAGFDKLDLGIAGVGQSVQSVGRSVDRVGQDVRGVGQAVNEGNRENKAWHEDISAHMDYNTTINASESQFGGAVFDKGARVWDPIAERWVDRPNSN